MNINNLRQLKENRKKRKRTVSHEITHKRDVAKHSHENHHSPRRKKQNFDTNKMTNLLNDNTSFKIRKRTHHSHSGSSTGSEGTTVTSGSSESDKIIVKKRKPVNLSSTNHDERLKKRTPENHPVPDISVNHSIPLKESRNSDMYK
eukprot:UN26650